MQLLESISSSVRSEWMCPAWFFETLKVEYAASGVRDMNVTEGSMLRRTRGPEVFRPRPMPDGEEVGDGTKLASVDGVAVGIERDIPPRPGRRIGGEGAPGSGMTSMET